jgi:hypothetical protein
MEYIKSVEDALFFLEVNNLRDHEDKERQN